jgi:hypothetical protein
MLSRFLRLLVSKFQKSAYMTLQTWSLQIKKAQNFMLTSNHEKIARLQVITH